MTVERKKESREDRKDGAPSRSEDDGVEQRRDGFSAMRWGR